MSLKGDILTGVVQRLSQIDPLGNAYSGTAMECRLSDGIPAKEGVPTIEVFQNGQTCEQTNYDCIVKLDLTAIAYGYAQQGKSIAIASADVEEQIAKALAKDRGWNKLAITTTWTGAETEITKGAFVLAISFTIEYSLTLLPN